MSTNKMAVNRQTSIRRLRYALKHTQMMDFPFCQFFFFLPSNKPQTSEDRPVWPVHHYVRELIPRGTGVRWTQTFGFSDFNPTCQQSHDLAEVLLVRLVCLGAEQLSTSDLLTIREPELWIMMSTELCDRVQVCWQPMKDVLYSGEFMIQWTESWSPDIVSLA